MNKIYLRGFTFCLFSYYASSGLRHEENAATNYALDTFQFWCRVFQTPKIKTTQGRRQHLVYVATGCGKKMLVAPYFLPLPHPSIINLTTQSLGFLKRNKKTIKLMSDCYILVKIWATHRDLLIYKNYASTTENETTFNFSSKPCSEIGKRLLNSSYDVN